MIVSNTESVVIPAARSDVFARAFDLTEMTRILRGWGPIPATDKVELIGDSLHSVGAYRRITNSDGSVLDEEILVHEPPLTHAYRLSGGFRGIAKLLVTEGLAEWNFNETSDGKTEVRWTYGFTLRSPLAWPIGVIMVRVAFGRMQRATLRRLREGFRASPPYDGAREKGFVA